MSHRSRSRSRSRSRAAVFSDDESELGSTPASSPTAATRRRRHTATATAAAATTTTSAAQKPTRPAQHGAQAIAPALYLKLGRPKFLYYSLLCHGVGLLLAVRQGLRVDWTTAALAQLTVWCCHLMTHYINEYGDVNADRLNKNAGSWTGGSKVLVSGEVPRAAAMHLGLAFLAATVLSGAATAIRVASRLGGVALAWPASPAELVSLVGALLAALPLEYVLIGVSVILVATAYSLPPLRLSAHALGEVCVAYVLTFAAPLTGLYAQGGHLSFEAACILLPACLVNLNRMIIMNLPDRVGDALDAKNTSVVLVGEERAVHITNALTLLIYFAVLPQLGLSRAVTLGYLAPLPLRWWQTLRINIPRWWADRRLVDSIPFVESMYVLATVTGLLGGLACDQSAVCQAALL